MLKFYFMQCRRHGASCLAIESPGGSTRLTDGKCCGSWSIEKTFRVREHSLLDARREINKALRRTRRASAPTIKD